MRTETLLQLPVFCGVDVLLVGTCSGAVAAALEIRRLGRSSMVIGEMSYFGEESAGTLNLWPESLDRADALVSAMFTGGNSLPAMPCHVKRVLESALLQASVPFMYLARPIALLRSEDGRLLGAIIAARTSLFVVRCSAVIDATRYGVVSRLAGTVLTRRQELPQTLSWIVLSDGAPKGWGDRAEELNPPFKQMPTDGEKAYGAYRLGIDRSTVGNDPLAREHLVRASITSPNVSVTADIISDVPSDFCATSDLADNPAKLSDGSFAAAPDLFLLNGLLPLTSHGATVLERSDAQVALGRRVGAIAAGSLQEKTDVAGTVNAFTGGGIDGQFRFAPAFLRKTGGILDIAPLAFPSLGSCDVVVAGGGTGGAPAAISAARAGAKTVVLESQHGLGGVGTIGLVSGYWFGNQVGFTAELDEAVRQFNTDYHSGKTCNWQHWQPELKSAVYQRLLQEAGGAAWLGSYAFGVRISGRQVDGVLVSTPFGCGLLEAGSVVDATGNADMAAAAGAPCRVIGADHLATQGTGLSPRHTPGVRGYNSDWTFVDETDSEGITAAFVNARAKFADSFDTSPMVNSRERRQIIGEYEISPLDILAHRTFPDTVVVARSNFDSHGFIVHPVFMVAEPDHDSSLQAHLPFRCMLPQGIEGVIVTGLGMSAHRDALPVLRMQADVQNQGFAAGLAAAMAVKGTRRLHELDVRKLQRRLVEVGIITPEIATQEDLFPLPDDTIADASREALRSPLHAAILFAHPEKSRLLLRSRLENAQDADGQLDAALILGLMGFPEAAPVLAEAVRSRSWDIGWNYKGMGQFGPSMSRLDALILALGRTREPLATDVIEEKIRQLDGNASFSHCRAVALATALLRDARLARALGNLLRQPGIRGHARTDLRTTIRQANGDPIETEARNASLRELYLARGLYLSGDVAGLGRSILETYSQDLRGHYARHARAVLESSMEENLSLEMA